MNAKRASTIAKWIGRIEASKLSVDQFFDARDVPFSRAQYFVHRRRLQESGPAGLTDRRCRGGNRKLTPEHEAFLKGCIKRDPDVSLGWLQQALVDEFRCEISSSAVSRALTRIDPGRDRKVGGRPKTVKACVDQSALGGFELIVALAYHLGWPKRTAGVIRRAIGALKRTDGFKKKCRRVDKIGRNKAGEFTGRYNRRRDVRKNRFASISDKRRAKNWHSMNLVKDSQKTIIRKSLAILSLPLVTDNGQVRSVNLAQGQALSHLCGFNYKQSSITKYLAELKYLGYGAQLIDPPVLS